MGNPDWEIVDGRFEPWEPGGSIVSGPVHSAPESLFALSNGYLGIRGTPGEGGGKPGTFVNGYFERSPIVYGEEAYGYARFHETIVSLPDGTGISIELDGESPGRSGRVLSKGSRLDLRRGVLERSLLWEAPDGRRVRVFSERLVSLKRPTLAALRVRFRLEGGSGSAVVRCGLDTKPANVHAGKDPRVGAKFRDSPYDVISSRAEGPDASASLRTRASGLSLGLASFCSAELSDKAAPQTLKPEGAVLGDPPYPALETSFRVPLADGAEIAVTRYLSYRRDPRSGAAGREEIPAQESAGELEGRARADVREAARIGFDALLEEHSTVLGGFWEGCGLDVEGPEGLAAALRFNLFHVFQAAGRDGITNVPAKGLTGEGYEGHCFWDTEIYLLPLLTYTAPKIARALLGYRDAILDRARERARELGHSSGALFPWRTISGLETSAYYPAGTAQYHIDADVAYALSRYIRASGDREFLRGAGSRILVETARLWMDAGHWGRDGRFRIDEVTGPDEYSALVNNNAYTNIMARANLRQAARAVRALASEEPGAWGILASELGLSPEEPDAWDKAADGMYVPYDEETGIIPQDDSFLDRETWDFAGTPPSKYPLLLHFHPLAIYRKRVLKQPDLLLALVLEPSEFSLAQVKRNFDFYEPLTTGDSSLSHCAMSMAAAGAGYPDRAWAYFLKTARLDLEDTHGNSEHGVHIAAMGGSWSALVYGFAGFRDDRDEWAFFPRLPSKLRGLSFRLRKGSGSLSVSLTHDSSEYRWEGAGSLGLSHEGERFELEGGGGRRFSLLPSFRAAIFDLDGVLADTAVLHARAWERLADEEGFEFPEEAREGLKGISRMEALELVLGARSAEFSRAEKEALAARKNGYYRQLVAALTPENALPGARELLEALRARGIKLALASASRNAVEVLERLDLSNYFDALADAARARPKPDPEIFLMAAEALGILPRDCAGFEDAQAGVEAIRAAGMRAVGVGAGLAGADLTAASLEGLDADRLDRLFGV